MFIATLIAKDELRRGDISAAADARIDHGDLTALLYAQGYKNSEWVDG